jgi:NAD(P)H-nitrite reductase large subunit
MIERRQTRGTTGQGESRPPLIERAEILILGNGIAGMTAAREAHRQKSAARIVMLTAHNHPTIYMPALKHYLSGRLPREQLVATPPDMERATQISLLRGVVSEVRPSDRQVVLASGRAIEYGSLLLATGSIPKGLPADLPGRDYDGVVTAHSLTDYMDMRRRLAEANEVVVIGGGLHGLETVLAVLHHRLKVTWLIRTPTCVPRLLDETGSHLILERVRGLGVRIETGTQAQELLGRVGAVSGVVTSRGAVIPAQLVIACTGVWPNTAPVARLSPALSHPEQGVFVDEWLRTGVPDIYAAGAVAAVKDLWTGAVGPRTQWSDAELQGAVAASMLVGGAPGTRSPVGASWHSATLGKLSLLAVGDTLGRAPGASTWTESKKGAYRRVTIQRDRVIGYLSIGASPPDPLAIKYVIDESLSVTDLSDVLMGGGLRTSRNGAFPHEAGHQSAEGMRFTHLANSRGALTAPPTPGAAPLGFAQPPTRNAEPETNRTGGQPFA